MTWTVEFFPFNIFETGTIEINGGSVSGFPESRLGDRSKSFLWKGATGGSQYFKVDQSANPVAIDFLAVANHNFGGFSLTWTYSIDDWASYDPAVNNWAQLDNADIIERASSPITANDWRLWTSGAISPYCGEIFMSQGFAFNCLREANPFGSDVDQVQWNQSIGGVERATKLGSKRRVRNYTFYLSPSEFDDFGTVVDYLDEYSKPFYFKDHADNYFLARFDELPSLDFNHNTHTRVGVRIIEML